MDLQSLLTLSIKNRASDLHIIPGMPPLLRINGDLIVIKDADVLTADDTRELIYGMLTSEQQKLFEAELAADIAISYPNIGHFRVGLFHQMRGVAAVFRVIPEKVPSFEDVGLPVAIKRLLSLSHGLVLVTGPTGSGKTTSLAAMIEYLNQNYAYNIITIEDPIEYKFTINKSAIHQIQVGRDTPDFKTALRAALRQDPDVIMLGELRDLETIRLALLAAETGHLILSTMHASSTGAAISRIVDIFPHEEKSRIRNALSETLQGVISQTLVKRISSGRVAAYEIMLANPAIKHLIHADLIPQIESTILVSGDIGMCTMEQSLRGLVAKREITLAMARATLASWKAADLQKE